ncbi:hydroxyacid dehydrogenase [Pseudomonas viridiflava]|uniref:2-hydroxyacid dehydrogenase n=1 Tax=Pseudomonas viridiflava TaxID=33069 RepID=UPI000F070295|nr:2-hydroxyacid dehydrogenase [Pseudomonas viridiflava]MDY0935503.1 2-hydroxyacid dehydrogenase [Pseudomonas viridiflava]MDY1011605.1 2-hydroxyacid dehydrogenase [Pseudomonas viridiflava]TKJ57733.1 hydroxyacid dehydrogenase [Pseudomonas viridiflava]TKK30657.1 hydroxyacid dehydrogenase [Pseudomonas viridiflava]
MTTVLVLVENLDTYLPILENSGFELIRAPTAEQRAEAIAAHGPAISAVVTRGPLGFFAEEMDALPNLRIICVSGAGYEKVDLPAAEARGITVTNGAGVNASTVADHALALLLSLVRDIPQADASVRRSEWRKVVRPSLAGKRLGIIGLGAVGLAIARRAAAFDIGIGYHNRKARSDCDYTWHASVQALAEASDILVIATPGGSSTHHLVNASVLAALGPEGFLVNIARASVVDTDALVAALREQKIAGAALDVFDDEPRVPDVFKTLDNVVLTPHVAGLSPEASKDSVQMVSDNLLAFFAGKPVLTPVHS